ncbi:hypothetical protein FSP39_017925 [Pinctada imbricata]|uniref:CUB domain-containing protein n=1 Tax=Pinctada imbricata TaxID=66713 RepID=A0AA88YMY2_PINIB|nr:hypothetical protein FSP39_017925 [Pinctada imbricata]
MLLQTIYISCNNDTECSAAICTRGKRKIQTLRCDQGTILIQNVTGNSDKREDHLSFLNIRRMCMGKVNCDVTRFCQSTRKSLKVSYFCLNESVLKCSSSQQEANVPSAVIRNNEYPSLGHTECSIRILVPQNHFVTITIHDIEKISTISECDGDIQLRTRQPCSGFGFPGQNLCAMHQNFTSFAACGDVDIRVSKSSLGLRYLITYAIQKLGSTPNFDYLSDLSYPCPDGFSFTPRKLASPRRLYPVQGVVYNPPKEIYEYGLRHNVTYVTVPYTYDRAASRFDNTERMVFYIALAVAVLSLTGLVIVTVICVKRQRHYKYSGTYNIDLSNVLNSKELACSNGPIGHQRVSEISRDIKNEQVACLQDGYSVVADEIPYPSKVCDSKSPAYAEVMDNVLSDVGIFRFRTEPEEASRRSPDNVYSDMNTSEKNVYHEIPEDYPHWRCPTLFTKDYKQLIKNREYRKLTKDKRSQHDANGKQHEVGQADTTYVTYDVSAQPRQPSRDMSASQRSDSDSSLVLTENEVYESFQSAHV